MAIACASCGKKVHEQTVVCPHCGGSTGVPADPAAVSAIARLKPPSAPPIESNVPLVVSDVVDVGAALVGAALDAIAPSAEPELPRAIARRRRAGTPRRRR